jgi:hypothetical protein
MGLFFSIMVIVLSAGLAGAIQTGLTQNEVPLQVATQVSHLPPTGALFAAFLGYNPMETLLPPQVLSGVSQVARENLLSTQFFPSIISTPFMDSLRAVFYFSAVLAVLAAVCSFMRGRQFIYDEAPNKRSLTDLGKNTH